MAAECGTDVPAAKRRAEEAGMISKEDKIGNDKLNEMERWLAPGADPVMRAALSLDPEARTGTSKDEVANWFVQKLHIDPRYTYPTNEDINYMYAEGLRAKDAIERTRKWSSKDEFHAFVNKVIFLPQDVFRRDILGGEDYFLRTQITRSKRDGFRNRMATKINTLSTHLDRITNVERKIVASAIKPLEMELGAARDQLTQIKDSGKATDADLKRAKLRVDSAQAAYDRALNGKHEDPAVGAALKALRTISMALDGRYMDVDSATGKLTPHIFATDKIIIDETRDPETGEPLWVHETRINHEQLMVVLKNSFGSYQKAKEVDAVMREITEFLNQFGVIARLGFKAERENMIRVMMTGEGRVDRAEAMAIVDKAMHLRMEDIYFPRQSVEALARIERMSVQVNTATDKIGMLKMAAADPKNFALPGEMNPNTMDRHLGNAMQDVSVDIPSVLHRYGNRMIDYWHNNELHLESNQLLDRMWKASRGIKSEAERKQFEQYVDGVSQYIADFVDRSKQTTQGGKLNEVFKIMTAWKAGLTMGFFNPSSPVVNLLEGQALILTRAGRNYFFDNDKKNVWEKINNELEIGLAHTDITEETYMGLGEVNVFKSSFADGLSNADRRRMGIEQVDNDRRWLTKMADATTAVAKRTIVLQRKAENINRARSFKAGAIMEYEFMDRYRGVFEGGDNSDKSRQEARRMVTDREMESLGLKESDFATIHSRKKAWIRIARERVVKAGFEMTYQTQWNYNQVARHFFEREPIGRLALMYQHYPLSWLSAWRRTYEVLDSLRRAGGGEGIMDKAGTRASLKAMYAPTSKDIAIGSMPKGLPPMNSEAMFALIAGSIAMTMTAIRHSSGIVVGQFFQHPLSESVEDMVKYVQYGADGQQEMKKSLFWGRGLVNQFTGPAYTDLMDAISLGALKAGIDDGDMPRWTSDILRGTVGFRPNDMMLTDYGRRQFSNAYDVLNETFMFGGMSVAPKAVRLSQSVPVVSDWIWNNSLMQGVGVQPIKSPKLQDLAYQSFRAVGVRDEKTTMANFEKRFAKDNTQ